MSGEKAEQALRWISDILTRSQISHLILGETGEQMLLDKEFDLKKIEIGVLDKDFQETTKRLFKTFLPEVELGDVISIDYEGAPIEIKIIKKHYKFFEHPDVVFYMADEYKVPNPWYRYWKSRFLIK